MGSGESVLKNKRVIVVGGGYAGAQAVSQLRGKCDLTIVDPREYFHYCIGGLRATVQPGFEDEILIPFEVAWGGIFKQGKAVSIDPNSKVVSLEDGSQLSYDIVIIATGTNAPFPGKIDLGVRTISEAKELFKAKQDQVKNASRITIIGAGAVGVELAAEIKTDYPEKDVTVISNGKDIVPGPWLDRFRDEAMRQLEALGVKFVLGEKVSNLQVLPTDGSETCTVRTDAGKEIEADLVVVSTGLHANSEAYEENFADVMDERRFLRVNEFLQVEGHRDVFALGDCNNADVIKMGFKAELQMNNLVGNLVAMETGRKLTPYTEIKAIFLTLGRSGGIGQYNSFLVSRFIVWAYKSRDVLVGRTRSIVLGKKDSQEWLYPIGFASVAVAVGVSLYYYVQWQ